jgi:sugar lactone lactonase YvrE
MNVALFRKLSLGLGGFVITTGWLRADFIQGQIPEFKLGAGQWSERRLFQAEDVAVDPISGKVFFSDAATHRILRFPASVSISSLPVNPAEAEAVLGQASVFDTGVGYFANGLNSPSGLAFDAAGNLYVVDSGNHRVVRFSAAAQAVSGAAADWVLGQASPSGNAQGSSAAKFNNPQGITLFGGYLAVADTGNNRVQVFEGFPSLASGASASRSYGTGSVGRSATAFNQPRSVAISSYGNIVASKLRLWVGDTGNNRVLRFDELDGTPIVDGTLYDKTADGVLGQTDFTTDTRGSIPLPTHMGVNSILASGSRLYVSDPVFGRVLRFENAGNKINGAAADGVLGQSSLTSVDPPVVGRGLALAGAALWTTTASGAARFDAPSSAVAIALPNSILSVPAESAQVDIRLMAEDRLLHKFYVYEPVGNRLIQRYTSCAAFRAGSPPEFTFQTGLTPSIELGITLGGLAAHNGRLTLSDRTKNRVIDISNAAFVTGILPAQATVIGQSNTTAVTAGLNDAGLTRMNSPTALCWATKPDQTALRLYVVDTGNHRVLSYTPALPSIAEIFGGEDGVSGITSTRLYQPQGIAYDADSGILFVADTGNHRLLQFRAFTIGSAFAVAPGAAVGVLGQASFTTATRGSGRNQLSDPRTLALLPNIPGVSSEIFVMDSSNYRVAVFQHNSVIVPSAPLSIQLTFNTISPLSTEIYPYPSSRNLSLSIGSLMLEFSDLKNPGSLWISGSQQLTWFQRDYTPTMLAVESPADMMSFTFSKRPFYQYIISTSGTLEAASWSDVAGDFYSENTRGTFAEARAGRPRQFYRVRETPVTD